MSSINKVFKCIICGMKTTKHSKYNVVVCEDCEIKKLKEVVK